MIDLAQDALNLAEMADAIEALVDYTDPDSALDLDDALTAWAVLEAANRTLARARGEWAKKVAAVMPDKRVTVENVGTFERHKKADRKAWDRVALLPDVLDTRIVDPMTGEVSDPDPLSKVLHVWNLGAPRVTALRERGLDPDEYCSVEYGGWTLQLVADNTPKEDS